MSENQQDTPTFTEVGDVLEVEVEGKSVNFRCDNALLRLSVRDEGVIRVRMTTGEAFTKDSSFLVLPLQRRSSPSIEFFEEEAGWCLKTSAVQVHINRSPCRLTFYDSQGQRLNEDVLPVGMSGNSFQVQCSKVLPSNEHFYGFGHKGGRLDKRGSKMIMWNQYFPYQPDTDPLSVNVPFFVAIRQGKAHGLFFDTTVRCFFDMGATSPETYTITIDEPELDYYFICGPSPKQVLYSYSQLTGKMPLPPRWTLGYHQCRYSYPNEQRIREVTSELRKRRIPCDSIWFDIHYLDGYRVFTWDKEAFPNPSNLIEDFAADGFRSVVIIDPGVKQEEDYPIYRDGLAYDYFLRKGDGNLFVGTVWPGAVVLPDFLQPKVRRWWGNLHTTLIEQGVAAIWNDMNEPQLFLYQEYDELVKVVHSDGRQTYPHAYIHNLYANLMNQSTFEALLRLRPNKRPWVLTRAGWAGVQRYAAVWTSDNSSKWDHLQVTIPMLLNLGMAGIPFVGADVGGFFNDCTPELFTRWIQMAVFTPFCRNHTYKDTVDQEPWAFTEKVETISRRYIEWRYQLLPYFYDLFYDASKTGTPIIRPLILEFPSDEHCHTVNDEFLLGSSLLVAPVLTEGKESREVYLPPGHWIDYHTKQRYTGPVIITVSAPLDQCPIFVRRGSIIPLQPVVQHSGEAVDLLHLDVYPSPNGSIEYLHYEDDGETLAYQHGEMATTQYWCHTEAEEIRLDILPSEGSYTSDQRHYMVTIPTFEKCPTRVLLNAGQLRYMKSVTEFEKAEAGWCWRENNHTVIIKFPDTRTRMELCILS